MNVPKHIAIILDGNGDLDWNLEQIRKAAEEAKTGKEQ